MMLIFDCRSGCRASASGLGMTVYEVFIFQIVEPIKHSVNMCLTEYSTSRDTLI